MKTKKLLLLPALLLAFFMLSGMNVNMHSMSVKTFSAKKDQCGVTDAAVATYLRNCSHHHSVTSVTDIPGTCNFSAAIENCGTATVYTSDGIVVGHMDNYSPCSGSITKKPVGNS